MSDLNPVLSRRTVSPAMAARGMRSAAALAEGKPCGTRVRYYAGCRCNECRAANSQYERERHAARANGETNRIVSAEQARAHLAWLSTQGVGRKTAADAAKVSSSVVSLIAEGKRTQIREATQRRILAVTPAAAADRAYIDGNETWRLLDELIACGYPRSRIASELMGRPVTGLQLKRYRVTVTNAERVRRAFERLRYATRDETSQAYALLRELRDEHYRVDQVLSRMAEIAARRALPAPTMNVAVKGERAGSLRLFEVGLLRDVHAALLGDATP